MSKQGDNSTVLMLAISKSIRERRVGLGVSQEELGNRADLHRTYISDIEAGRRNLSLRSLFRLASGLGLSVSELLKLAEARMIEVNNRINETMGVPETEQPIAPVAEVNSVAC
jgi:transcriptional regulator with XRE-family HTH domain